MDARLTPWRLLTCALAIVALASVMSACGGGTDAKAAPQDPPALAQYSNSFLSFTYPAAWKAYPYRWNNPVLHFDPLVYLSTQPVENPCSTTGNETSCGFPVEKLPPGGVLITWEQNGMPATGVGAGTRTQVDGHPASRIEQAGGECGKIGADRTINVAVQTSPPPSALTYFTACLRGPGLAQAEKSVDALLTSTKFTSNS
jgi:hypothetical protein